MISGLGSSSSMNLEQMRQMQLNRLKSTDTNSDGAIDEAEFIAGAPDDVSSDQASALFKALDSEGQGSLSISDVMTSFESMSSDMQSVLLQAQETSTSSSRGGQGGGFNIEDMLASLDTDEDGQISRDEFVQGRPDEVSEEQAASLFDSMDSEGQGSMSIDDLSTAMAQNRPPMGPPPSGGSASSSDSTIEDLLASLDTDEDGQISRDEFVQGRPDDLSEEQAASMFDSLDSEGEGSMSIDDLSAAMAQNRPPVGGPPPGGGPMMASSDDEDEDDEDDDTTTTTSSSTETDAASLLLKALEESSASSTSGTSSSADEALSNQQALMQALQTAMNARYSNMARSASNSATFMAA